MLQSEICTVECVTCGTHAVRAYDLSEMSDRDVLEAIYASQMRTELLVQNAIEALMPTVEAFSKGGVMGLMSMMGKR